MTRIAQFGLGGLKHRAVETFGFGMGMNNENFHNIKQFEKFLMISQFSFEGAVACRDDAGRRLKDGGEPGV
jgi:hypothetical protein